MKGSLLFWKQKKFTENIKNIFTITVKCGLIALQSSISSRSAADSQFFFYNCILEVGRYEYTCILCPSSDRTGGRHGS